MKTKKHTKRWMLLSALMLLFTGVRAEKVPMIDSLGTFKGNFPPAEWLVVNKGVNAWAASWSGGYADGSGSNNYTQVNFNVKANDAWLITPQLKPVEGKDTLFFYVKRGNASTDNALFDVMVSESGNGIENFKTSLLQIENKGQAGQFTATWEKKFVKMSDYDGKAVFVAFRVRNNDKAPICLDWVTGIPLAVFDKDVAISNLLLKPDWLLFAGDEVEVNVSAQNRGKAAETVKGTLSIGGDATASLENEITLQAKATGTLKFNHTFAAAGDYTLMVSVPEDDNLINDTLRQRLKVYPAGAFVADFHKDKVFPPKDWMTYVGNIANENISFWHNKFGSVATTAAGQIQWNGVSTLLNGKPAVKALITPQLKVSDQDKLTFFAKRAGLYGDKPFQKMKFRVLLSESGNDFEDFTEVLASYGIGNAEGDLTEVYQQYTIDMSSHKDKNVFIAFVMVDSAGVGVSMNLDEVGGTLMLSSFANDARIKWAALDNPNVYRFAGDKITLRALVENKGTNNLSNLAVSLKANGTQVGTAKTIASVEKGKVSDTLVFEYTIPQAGGYKLEVSVPADDNNINNALDFSFDAYPAGYFIEGFEGLANMNAFPPKYWFAEKTAANAQTWWGSVNNVTNAHQGVNATYASQLGYKLITPLLNVSATDSFCLYAKRQSDTGKFYVLTSTDAKTWDTLATHEATATWTLFKTLLKDKETAFFGNRYFAIVAGAPTGSLYVDDVFGGRYADRANQVALSNVWFENIAVVGKPIDVKAVLYNDGTQAQSKTIKFYLGEEQLATATSRSIAPGAYDTLSFNITLNEAVSNGKFRAELPEDASWVDNVFAFSAHVYAPEIWRFADGFEEKAHPYWMFYPLNNTTIWQSKPQYNAVTPATGEEYLHLALNLNSKMLAVSPLLDLRFSEYEVSLDVYRDPATQSSDRPDRVELGFAATPDWGDEVVFVDSVNRLASGYPVATEGWYHFTKRVRVEDLESGFFMIRAVPHLKNNAASFKYMRFDNLVIRPVMPVDAEMTAITLPSDTLFGKDNIKTALKAVLLNNGTDTLRAANIHYGIGATEKGITAWSGILPPGKDTLLVVTEALSLPFQAQAELYVEVKAAQDGNTLNDRITKQMNVKKAYNLPFVANFETKDWNKDWQNFTNSSDTNVKRAWFVDTTGEYITAPFGKACANSASLDEDRGAVHPDNWLVTPGLHIKYSKAYLSFYVQATDKTNFAEKFQVLVSTKSNTDSAFFTPVHTQTLNNDSLKHIRLELNGYRDEVVYIAFRHFDCTDQYRLLLDSVYVYDPQGYNITATVAPAEAGSVTGAGFFLAGEQVSLAATAKTGYNFLGWLKDNDTVSKQNPYEFVCEGNLALTACFAAIPIPEYTITLTAGNGGSVNPSGEVKVKEGENLQVSITANNGYEIEDVKVDGQSVGAVSTYTFQAVDSAHTLNATFRKTVTNESLQAEHLSVSPNPFTSQLNIRASSPMKSIRIINLQGREVLHQNAGGVEKITLRVNLPEGLYVVMVETTNGQRFVQRVVKASSNL